MGDIMCAGCKELWVFCKCKKIFVSLELSQAEVAKRYDAIIKEIKNA